MFMLYLNSLLYKIVSYTPYKVHAVDTTLEKIMNDESLQLIMTQHYTILLLYYYVMSLLFMIRPNTIRMWQSPFLPSNVIASDRIILD